MWLFKKNRYLLIQVVLLTLSNARHIGWFQDDKLTKEEVLDKYDLFVGSQATDFGEALARHDEF